MNPANRGNHLSRGDSNPPNIRRGEISAGSSSDTGSSGYGSTPSLGVAKTTSTILSPPALGPHHGTGLTGAHMGHAGTGAVLMPVLANAPMQTTTTYNPSIMSGNIFAAPTAAAGYVMPQVPWPAGGNFGSGPSAMPGSAFYGVPSADGSYMSQQPSLVSGLDMSGYMTAHQGGFQGAPSMFYMPATSTPIMSNFQMPSAYYPQAYLQQTGPAAFRPPPTSSSLSAGHGGGFAAPERRGKKYREGEPNEGIKSPVTKQVKKRRSRQKRKGLMGETSKAASAAAQEEAEANRSQDEKEGEDILDEAVSKECYGEKRMAINFTSYGLLGEIPQRMGNRNLFVPNGLKGCFSKYAEEWEFEVSHSRAPVLCEDGQNRVCVTWTIAHPASGEKTVATETPREAMTREKLGRTICNKVFRDALEKRKVEYEKALEEEHYRSEPNESKISNLEALIETLGNHRFAQGPLVFGLYHRELQTAIARQWRRLQRKDKGVGGGRASNTGAVHTSPSFGHPKQDSREKRTTTPSTMTENNVIGSGNAPDTEDTRQHFQNDDEDEEEEASGESDDASDDEEEDGSSGDAKMQDEEEDNSNEEEEDA